MQKIDIEYDSDSVCINVGVKKFYARYDDNSDYPELFGKVLKELGYEVEVEECY